MNIAVIGGGLTGLTAAYELSKQGHDVTVLEKTPILGGLAHGFTGKGWLWPLEFAYHHFFTSDKTLIGLLTELGMKDDIILKRPITATLLPPKTINHQPSTINEIFQLDSPLSLLKFPRLSLVDRLRTGAMLAYAKLTPFWKPLENITAEAFIRKTAGDASWKTIWEPLLVGKFADYSSKVSAAWFWARIAKRTTNLGYIRGGFQTFVNRLAEAATAKGVKIYVDTDIQSIRPNAKTNDFTITLAPGRIWQKRQSTINYQQSVTTQQFDKVLLTVPSPIATRLVEFPREYKQKLLSIPHLFAQILILETDRPILNSIYWLNINDRSFPFLACVAHTNYMDKTHYAGHHITYFGNYLPEGHPYLSMDKSQLLNLFRPYIQKLISHQNAKSQMTNDKSTSKSQTIGNQQSTIINQSSTINAYLFTAPHAQPVHLLHYSKRAPALATPIPNLYLANLDSISPWDRGTNYAVEWGQKAALRITQGT